MRRIAAATLLRARSDLPQFQKMPLPRDRYIHTRSLGVGLWSSGLCNQMWSLAGLAIHAKVINATLCLPPAKRRREEAGERVSSAADELHLASIFGPLLS